MSPPEQDRLVEQVRLHERRRAAHDSEPSVARRLAQIGVLGWIVVLPILGGLLLGSWLDGVFHSGLQCKAALLMLGAACGLWSAWKWMQRA